MKSKKIVVVILLTSLFAITSTVSAQSYTQTRPKSCLIEVNSIFRELNAEAKKCKNARDNLVPLVSQKYAVLSGSADDLFNLSLDRVEASPEQFTRISAAEAEVVSTRDQILKDLNPAIEESGANAADICKGFDSKTTAYNSSVSKCSRAKKRVVKISCNVSLRYSKRDAQNAKNRCSGVTKLETTTNTTRTGALADVDSAIAKYRTSLEKASSESEKAKIKDELDAAIAARAKFVEQIDSGLALIRSYKTTVCNESTTVNAAYSKLVKDCAKK